MEEASCFRDTEGYSCNAWRGYSCFRRFGVYSSEALAQIRSHCAACCGIYPPSPPAVLWPSSPQEISPPAVPLPMIPPPPAAPPGSPPPRWPTPVPLLQPAPQLPPHLLIGSSSRASPPPEFQMRSSQQPDSRPAELPSDLELGLLLLALLFGVAARLWRRRCEAHERLIVDGSRSSASSAVTAAPPARPATAGDGCEDMGEDSTGDRVHRSSSTASSTTLGQHKKVQLMLWGNPERPAASTLRRWDPKQPAVGEEPGQDAVGEGDQDDGEEDEEEGEEEGEEEEEEESGSRTKRWMRAARPITMPMLRMASRQGGVARKVPSRTVGF